MGSRRSSVAVLAVATVLSALSLSTAPGQTAGAIVVVRRWLPAIRPICDLSLRGPLTYHYPVRPFLVQHPIRGNFGDPRTLVDEGYVGSDTPHTPGSFTFHNGVDISAPAGTAVYPVVSGRATIGYADEVIVATGDDRVFQYFHIKPLIHPGQRVIAYRTILGPVLPEALHVHLTEIDGFRVHNPVDPGHLEPYTDHTVPEVLGVLFSDPANQPVDPTGLHGTVYLAADAEDEPPLPVPVPWLGFPVTPALVSWRLTTSTGATVVPPTIVADFRHTLPPNRDFWRVYAAGTYQNFPVFGHIYFFGKRGRYLFNLTPNGLDTSRLHNGTYVLGVQVADVCGNRGLFAERIAVHNP
jgi:hypothetical protein